jgi:signal transduction histidine kinase
VALAIVLLLFSVLGTLYLSAIGDPPRPLDALGLGLIVLVTGSIATRREATLASYSVSTLATGAYLALGFAYGPIQFALCVAAYSLGRYEPPRRTVLAVLVGVPVVCVHLFTNPAALSGLFGLAPASAWILAPVAVGLTVRQVRASAAAERAELVRTQVFDERLRLTHEVHDVVGHGLAAIAMQADVARHVLSRRPHHAEQALEAISSTAHNALDELREVLALVRAPADRRPTPGLGQLEDLKRRVEAAGVQVDLVTLGVPRELEDAADLTAYRVVQEALTNVLRHSSGRKACIELSWDTSTLQLSVLSHGSQSPDPRDGETTGIGLAGMRRRVEALDGSLSTYSTPQTYRVIARIPAMEAS